MLTPHCSAASGIVVPPSIVSTTRLRKSAEYGFAIHAGLLPADSLNHIRAAMGIPDSAFPGNALSALEITLVPEARGGGNSIALLNAMKWCARAHGSTALFAPVRPHHEHLRPHLSLASEFT